MKWITRSAHNKRRHRYNVRATKAANGYSKHFADYPNRVVRKNNSALCVYGNFDHLHRLTNFYFKRVIQEHPTDFRYYREAYVLTDAGHKRLKTLRMMKRNNIRFWEYMHNTDTN